MYVHTYTRHVVKRVSSSRTPANVSYIIYIRAVCRSGRPAQETGNRISRVVMCRLAPVYTHTQCAPSMGAGRSLHGPTKRRRHESPANRQSEIGRSSVDSRPSWEMATREIRLVYGKHGPKTFTRKKNEPCTSNQGADAQVQRLTSAATGTCCERQVYAIKIRSLQQEHGVRTGPPVKCREYWHLIEMSQSYSYFIVKYYSK